MKQIRNNWPLNKYLMYEKDGKKTKTSECFLDQLPKTTLASISEGPKSDVT